MTIRCSLAPAAVLLVAITGAAHADERRVITLAPVCAEVDGARDALDPEARATARLHLVRALERADLLVVDTGCVETYVIAHVQSGHRLTIDLDGPAGTAAGETTHRDPHLAYPRLVRALLAQRAARAAAPPASTSPEVVADAALEPSVGTRAVDLDVVTAGPPAIDLGAAAEPGPDGGSGVGHELHGRIGFAGVAGVGSGYALAVGYRRARNRFTVGAGLALVVSDEVSTVSVRAEAVRRIAERGVASWYVGGGLGLGAIDGGGGTSSGPRGSGFEGELTVGYALAPRRGGRFDSVPFVQVDISVPFYGIGDDPLFAPTFALSVGSAIDTN